MKLRNGLHESKDDVLHVSGRHFTLYETATGDFKLVPKKVDRPTPLKPRRKRRR